MQLLKHFHKLSLDPKNASELKGLIQQLAVEGKLTENWRKENSKIKIDTEKVAKTLNIEKNELLNHSKTIKELVVPRSWLKVKFSLIFDMKGGSQPPKSKFINKPLDGYIRLFQIRDFGKKPVPVYVPSDSVSKLCSEDDIMIGRYGASIGKIFYGQTGAYNVALVRLIWDRQLLLQDFVYQMFSSMYIQTFFQNCSRSAQAGFNKNDMGKLNITLPPLEEQKEIVRIVKILFKEVEQLETLTQERVQLKQDYVASALHQLATQHTQTAWQELTPHFSTFFDDATNIKKLRKSILQMAVQGKLTADWRARHPEFVSGSHHATELLKSIQKEKAELIKEKKIKKEKALPPITAEEIPYQLPEGWVWCRFQDLILDIEAGKSPKCNPEAANIENWGVIKMSAISWGKFDPNENKSLPIGVEIFADKEIKSGDFILTRANTSELIAKSIIVPKSVRPKLLLNDKTLRINFTNNISVKYVNLYNNGSQARIHYRSVSTGTSDSMQNISRDNIKLLKVPIPPLEEQKAIVEKVNVLMRLCDELEQEVQTGEQQLEDLMQSVLREVFEGDVDKEEVLPMAAEPEGVYEKSTFDEIFESLNYDHEVAAIVLLTQERFGFTYGKKYIHKMFSNIDFLNELPVFKELQFQENGWGMYSPIIHKTLENEVFVTYKSLSANKKALQVKPKAIPKINKWINARENEQFINQVKQMLTIYEQPLIDHNMDRIELLNTVLECITVLKTDLLKDIRSKMKNWKMFEGNYKTKAEKFSENETLHMIHFIKGLKQTNQYMTYKHNTNN